MAHEQILHEICISRRIVPLNGEVTYTSTSNLQKIFFQMALLDNKQVANLVIDSNGGSVIPALKLYDLIKGLPFPVQCTIIGDCHSAALLVSAACYKRRATMHSRFFFHSMQSTGKLFSTKDIDTQLEQIKHEQSMIFEQGRKVQCEAFNLSDDSLTALMKRGEEFDIALTAPEALEKGVIHEIIEKLDFLM